MAPVNILREIIELEMPDGTIPYLIDCETGRKIIIDQFNYPAFRGYRIVPGKVAEGSFPYPSLGAQFGRILFVDTVVLAVDGTPEVALNDDFKHLPYRLPVPEQWFMRLKTAERYGV